MFFSESNCSSSARTEAQGQKDPISTPNTIARAETGSQQVLSRNGVAKSSVQSAAPNPRMSTAVVSASNNVVSRASFTPNSATLKPKV